MSFFLVPIIGTGTHSDPLRPKYVADMGIPNVSFVRFGASAITYANATPADEATIGANADAVVVPPLDNTIGSGALSAVQAEIEALNMPAGWVSVGMTYRSVLRVLVGMAQLIQRVTGILGSAPVIAGHLNDTIGSFSVAIRNAIAQACDDLGINRTNITGSTTLRAALLDFGQQFIAGRTITLGDL